MKNTFFILFLIAIAFTSCKPAVTLVDTSCPGYRKMNFQRELIPINKIGIMPVLGGDEKEQYRRPMGDALTKHLKISFGDANVKSTNEVISILNDNNLANSYSKAIDDYRTTGIVPKEMVSQLGEALNVQYLLYTRLLANSEYLGSVSSPYGVLSRIDEIYVQCQVWDAKMGDIVWEGKGGTAKLTTEPADMIDKTAQGLANVIGNSEGNGPCQDRQK